MKIVIYDGEKIIGELTLKEFMANTLRNGGNITINAGAYDGKTLLCFCALVDEGDKNEK